MIDRTGKVFGRLTITQVALDSRPKNIRYLCQCECGNIKSISLKNLTKGHTKSCGCLLKEYLEKMDALGKGNRTKKIQAQKLRLESRGEPVSKNPLYQTWNSMIRRCHDPKATKYFTYGAKGIHVCQQWRDSLVQFCNDMGPKPSPQHTIDRINPTGNYEPSNCRWADEYTQCSNRRVPLKIQVATIKGKTLMVARWASTLKLNKDKIKADIKVGYSPEVAIIAAKLRKNIWEKTQGKADMHAYKKCYAQAEQWLNSNPS